jgi:hypothetical protein
LNIGKTTKYDVRNTRRGLGQATKCGGIKPVDEIPTLDNWTPNDYTEINIDLD